MFASYHGQSRPSAPVSNGRKVFSNAMVAHVWAQQTNYEGRSNNGNFYFRDSTIFSYGGHFPIAKFSADKSVIWFTSRGYSVSTGGHIRYTEDALRGAKAVIVHVPDLGEFDERHISKDQRAEIEESIMRRARREEWDAFQRVTGKPNRAWPENYQERVKAIDAKRAKAALESKISAARKVIDSGYASVNPALIPSVHNEALPEWPSPYFVATQSAQTTESLRGRVMSARATLSRQKAKTKIDATRIRTATALGSHLIALRDAWRSIVEAMESSRDESCDRAEIESALDAIANGKPRSYWFEAGVGDDKTTETEILSSRIKRALRIGFTSQQIAPLMDILQSRLFYRESDRSTAESIDIVHQRRMASYGRSRVTDFEWRNGKGSKAQYYFASTLVRRVGDTLETSRGAECPFKHAVVAFLKAQECRATNKAWHRNGQQIRVGHFQVDSIDAQGNMQAGCHTLAWSEMLRLAIKEVPHLVKPSFGLPVLLDS